MQQSLLVVEIDPETGNHGNLYVPLVMSYKREGLAGRIEVPKGFRTDFASVPQILRSLIPQLGTWTAPAIAHDYMYWAGPSGFYTRDYADRAFLFLMEDALVHPFYRKAIYSAIRIGGKSAWNEHRELDHKVDDWK